ncbi:MAG: DUF721 domain-containing protein [Candidatus Omnitrophica bacterium]|nr:DUF721 domain-containing protein [Candidatus Omnitrophota bacterium]
MSEIILPLLGQFRRRASQQKDLVTLWERTIGAKRGAHTKVSALEGGVLTVWVDNSSFLYELSLKKEEIFKKLKRHLKTEDLKEIRFQLGRIE